MASFDQYRNMIPTSLPAEVIEFISGASKEELDELSNQVTMARKRWGKWRVKTLEVGDKVTWTSGKQRGKYANKTFVGTVTKINTTRVKVQADHGFGMWNVPGSMLEIVQLPQPYIDVLDIDMSKTLTLEYVKSPFNKEPDPGLYRVSAITNSVVYNPGELLEKKVVEDLCRGRTFSVKIK